MAIKKPARKTQNPLTTGGGGAGRGGSMGTGGGAPRSSVTVSKNVKVVGKRPSGPNSGKPLTEGKMLSGAEQARAQNQRMLESKQTPKGAKALKSINKQVPKTKTKSTARIKGNPKKVDPYNPFGPWPEGKTPKYGKAVKKK